MTAAATLAALALSAAQADPDAPAAGASSSAQPAPPTIDSLLDQPPITEDQRRAAVQSAYAAAQARRGELDGRWRLVAPGGQPLFVFQLSDPGQIADPRSSNPHAPVIEGAWLDAARSDRTDGAGFLAAVERTGDALIVRFTVPPGPGRARTVVLHRRADGTWAGDLRGEGATQAVVMARY